MTEEDVKAAIRVLGEYAHGDLSGISAALLEELERSIEVAWDNLPGAIANDEVVCNLDLADLFDRPPLAESA